MRRVDAVTLEFVISLALSMALTNQTTPVASSYSYAQSGYCQFGMCVGAAGDVDRDGCPDWIVSDQGYSKDGIVPRIWVLSGKSSSVLRSIPLPFGDASSLRIEGGHDVDADGVPDVLVGVAPFSGPKDPSSVHLVSGASGAIMRTLPARTVRQDNGAWTRFVRDVDGDGAADVAVLSCNADASRRTLVLHSGRSGDVLSTMPVEGAPGEGACAVAEMRSDSGGTRAYAVLLDGVHERSSFVQLLDGKTGKPLWRRADSPEPAMDCYGQLVQLQVGTGPSILAVAYGDVVDLLDGATGKRIHRLTPVGKTDSEMGYGWDLASLGDIDSDGTADVAVSETESGLSIGLIHAVSGKTGAKLWSTFSIADDVYRLGYSMASLGDVDGDGCVDLAAGTWGCKAGVPGRAFVVSGKTGAILREVRRKGDGVVVQPETVIRAPR